MKRNAPKPEGTIKLEEFIRRAKGSDAAYLADTGECALIELVDDVERRPELFFMFPDHRRARGKEWKQNPEWYRFPRSKNQRIEYRGEGRAFTLTTTRGKKLVICLFRAHSCTHHAE